MPSERLHDVVVRSRLQAAHPLELLSARGQHQDGHLREVADALERREPVQLRHIHVEDHEVGAPGVDLSQARAAVGGLVHRVAGTAEELPEQPADVRIVVDDEHPRVAHRPTFGL